MGYDSDLPRAIEVIREATVSASGVLQDPPGCLTRTCDLWCRRASGPFSAMTSKARLPFAVRALRIVRTRNAS